MSAIANITFGYDGTDFKRNYALELADSIAPADRNDFVRNAVKAINASIAGGTDGGMSAFFLADDYNGTIGAFSGISYADVSVDNVNIIYPANGGN